MSGDTLRKAGVGVKLAYDANVLRSRDEAPQIMMGVTEDQQTVEENPSFRDEAVDYIQRQKLRDLARENNKVYRAEARDALLREAVIDAARTHGVYLKDFTVGDGTELKVSTDGEMVIALGDIHFGEVIDVRGLLDEVINYYDEEVCHQRMSMLLKRACDIARDEQVGRIHIMLVGDCIAGMLRMSQLQNLQYGIVDSTIYFSEMFAQWVRDLQDRTGLPIDLYMVGGNHDEVRPLGSKAGDFPKDNMVKIINWYLYEKLTGYQPMIQVHELTGNYQYAEVAGFKFLMLHGQGGRISDICRDAVNVYGKHIDYFVCGHLHHEEELASGTTRDGNSIIVRVPSLCGVDGFAQRLGRFSKPGATVLIMQPNYGRKCVYPILL
jgi:predicted phosphodiesterase